jgi:hypothetical protein
MGESKIAILNIDFILNNFFFNQVRCQSACYNKFKMGLYVEFGWEIAVWEPKEKSSGWWRHLYLIRHFKVFGSGKKCAFSSSKVRAALKKQTADRSAKSYRQSEWKLQAHHKKYLTEMGVYRKAKKSTPKTTERQQSVIKARLKLLTQNFFSA